VLARGLGTIRTSHCGGSQATQRAEKILANVKVLQKHSIPLHDKAERANTDILALGSGRSLTLKQRVREVGILCFLELYVANGSIWQMQ
jgi:hypothetical protein